MHSLCPLWVWFISVVCIGNGLCIVVSIVGVACIWCVYFGNGLYIVCVHCGCGLYLWCVLEMAYA